MVKLIPGMYHKKIGKQHLKGQSLLSNRKLKKIVKGPAWFYPEKPSKDKTSNSSISDSKATNKKIDTPSTTTTAKILDSYASKYCKCSNTAFSQFLNHFQQSSVIQNEMLAILSAVVSVITQNESNESSSEYYSALMKTLDQAETDQSILATLSLLKMLLSTVPKKMLQSQFNEASQTFIGILKKYSSISDNHLIIRHCIECLTVLLLAQAAETLNNDLVTVIYDKILTFIVHTKPKIRKVAQHSICLILKNLNSTDTDKSTNCCQFVLRVADYCVLTLKSSQESEKSCINNTKILHVLAFLKDIIPMMPPKRVKVISKELLNILRSKNTMLTSCCLQTLHSLFTSQTLVLSSQFSTRIISTLYDYQLKTGESDATLAWLAVIQQAMCNVAKNDLEECSLILFKILTKMIELWKFDDEKIVYTLNDSINIVIQECLTPMCINNAIAKKYKDILRKIIQLAHEGLKDKSIDHSVRLHTLIFIKTLYQVIGRTCAPEMAQCLTSLADLHDCHNSKYSTCVENAIEAAVKSLGPELVLSKIPLKTPEGDFDNRRIWLLSVLSNAINESTLSYFRDAILPLAMMCDNKSIDLQDNNDQSRAHTYKTLYNKIWSLLLGFCNNPIDIKSNFKTIANILSLAITDKKDLRMVVVQSLKKLIIISIEKKAVEDIQELKKFSSVYLPSLIDCYITKTNDSDEETHRCAVLDLIKLYLSISSKDTIGKIFVEIFRRLDVFETDDFLKDALFDLIQVLINFIDGNKLENIYEKCGLMINDKMNSKDQQKWYKILEEILLSQSEFCHKFVEENREKIQKMFVEASENMIAVSKENRLYCLRCLIKSHPKLQKTNFLKSIIPEIVMCVKEYDETCRKVSYELLNEIADKFETNVEFFEEYISMLIVGGDPSYVSSSLLGLTGIIFKYHSLISDNKLAEIVKYLSTLITGTSREIINSVIGLLKVLTTSLSITSLRFLLTIIMKCFTVMTDDCKRHFRKKISDILLKLVKKFDFKTISKMVPLSDEATHRRLESIEQNNLNNKDENCLKNKNNRNLISAEGKKRKREFNNDNDDHQKKSLKADKTLELKPLRRSTLNKKYVSKFFVVNENYKENIK
ncbi:hypothetical protein HCN44_003401 [Aphidius gifuensis]|uniref:RRP12-like protein n=1 Tax=Aphidius gifuensis TaxID=684658 RepID=A0A834XY40_APHGI|nr:hypothetical protein HCN44_003401 [Aphidius gifuensis]